MSVSIAVRRSSLRGLAVALLVGFALHAAALADDTESREAQRIVAAGAHPWLMPAPFGRHRAAMETLYGPGGEGLVWLADAASRAAAREVIAVLGAAAGKGLDPRDYDGERLAARFAAVAGTRGPPGEAAALDVALSVAFMRFLSDVHRGRVDPRQVGFGLDVAPQLLDAARTVREAAATGRVREAVAAVEPRTPMYAPLIAALARYRALADGVPLPVVPLPATGKVAPGDAYAGFGALVGRLIAFGDLAPDSRAAPGDRYDGATVSSVQRFQARHGLDADGIVGQATLAALNTAPEARVRQLEFALERLRWLPDAPATRAVLVNIAAYTLWAFDPERLGERPALRMKVIVGRAVPTHRTPLLAARMTFVEFSPFWNVPPGILQREVLPRLRRDPGHLQREHMEIVAGDGKVWTRMEPEALAALSAGHARVRQRPGPSNAVGGVKFVFPNPAHVYLHDTPARELFARARRDFSHGCIRVAEPARLAQFVLAAQPEWTPERIRAAMGAGDTRFVALAAPVPVLIYYLTAMVDPDDGRLLFLPDIYGYDETLARALAARRASPAADAAGVQVHEVGGRVVADAAGPQTDCGVAQVGQRHPGKADVDRPSLEVQARFRHAAAAALPQRLVGGR
jgi:murein L,D-transpeptidase YcbB/YkuD